jgi:tetratricopeptide (TPR) repeat protein
MQLSGEALDQQIAELQARQKTEPQSVDLARRLGTLCEQKDDIESAIKWYQCAVELTGSSDPGLIRKLSNLKMRGAERDIAAHEEFLAGHTKKDAAHTKRSEELQAAKKKRAGILIEEVKKRLERNPTDLQLRFELGEHFVNAQRFREAVPELQRARQNPNARLKAMNLLGVCYCELGMLDLAMKQFEDAAREIVTMDPMKKEIVYNLGIVYEKMGEREKSLNCMKHIYEADSGYRDVAERVESSYQQDKGGS